MPILRFLRLLRVLSPFHTGKFLSKVAVESQLSQETFSVNSPLTKVYNLRKSLSQHRTCSLFCSKETFYWESGLIKCATCYHKYRGGGATLFWIRDPAEPIILYSILQGSYKFLQVFFAESILFYFSCVNGFRRCSRKLIINLGPLQSIGRPEHSQSELVMATSMKPQTDDTSKT